jgi:outer membrane protein TolC
MEAPPIPKNRQNLWIWISAVLAVVSIGLLEWALRLKSDRNSAQAHAEADQARAEADAANAKLEIAADCAKAYVSAFGVSSVQPL